MGWNLLWRNCIQSYLRVWNKLSVESKQLNLQGCYKLFASQFICTMNQSRKIQLNINSLWLIFFFKASDIDCTWESNKAQVIENVTIWTSLDLSQKNFQNKFLTLCLLDYDKNVGLVFFTHGFTIWRYFGCHSTKPSPCPPVPISLLIYRNTRSPWTAMPALIKVKETDPMNKHF